MLFAAAMRNHRVYTIIKRKWHGVWYKNGHRDCGGRIKVRVPFTFLRDVLPLSVSHLTTSRVPFECAPLSVALSFFTAFTLDRRTALQLRWKQLWPRATFLLRALISHRTLHFIEIASPDCHFLASYLIFTLISILNSSQADTTYKLILNNNNNSYFLILNLCLCI